MGIRPCHQAAGGAEFAAEGCEGAGLAGRAVPIPFFEDWRGLGALPGDWGDRSGQEDRKMDVLGSAALPP